MSVSIRLSRYGRIHRPLFRIVVIDKRCHREGMSGEILGHYDPLAKDKTITVALDKVLAWVGRGAQVSPSLAALMKQQGYQLPRKEHKAPERPKGKAVGPKGVKQAWSAPSRRSRLNRKNRLKAERKATAAAAKPAEAPAAEAAEAPKA